MMATLFYNPIQLPSGASSLLLILPLVLAVAIVYKTVRTRNLSRLWIEISVLMAYMVAGLVALGAGLWILTKLIIE